MEDKAQYFMREALNVARDGLDAGELPVGAVVVLNDKVIASAYTREVAEGRMLVHADLLALETADTLSPFPGRRRDTKLFVNVEPCLMCLGAAMSFFLGEIYYGLDSPSDGAVKLVNSWRRQVDGFPAYRIPRITGGILAVESDALIRQYIARYPAGPRSEWARSLLAPPA